MRTTMFQVRNSRIPQVFGACPANLPEIASYVNEAQLRLIEAGGDQGWWGTFVKVAFNVSKDDPIITQPREIARLENIDVCREPVLIQNQFYEYLQFGIGEQRPLPSCATTTTNRCGCLDAITAFDRGTVPMMRDITPGSKLRIYMTNGADTAKRIFFEAKDGNDKPIYTMDRGVQVNGFFITLDNVLPFVESPMNINSISNVTKDITVGAVQVYQVNPSTGEQALLSIYAPTEQTPSYRRYFLQNLPTKCCDCDSPNGVVQVTAMAKLEFIPVAVDTDFLLIGNIPALKEECQSIRYSEMDTANAKQLSEYHHRNAIRLLNKEIIHYLGKERPAFNFSPFGNATLESQGIGVMI